jgi:hypothetical protein
MLQVRGTGFWEELGSLVYIYTHHPAPHDWLGGTDFDVAIAHHLLHDANADERDDSRRRHSSGGGSDGRSVIQIVAKPL